MLSIYFGSDLPILLYEYACLLTGFLLIAAVFFICRVGMQGERRSAVNLLFVLAFGVYIGMVFDVTGSGTLYELLRSGLDLRSINLIPFSDDSIDRVGYILNVVMLVPLGFLVPFLWRGTRKLWKVTAIGAGLSVLVELSQLLNFRSTDVDDVLLNTLGAMIGYGLWRLYARIIPWDPGKAGRFFQEGFCYIAVIFLGKFFFYNEMALAARIYGF